MHTITRSLLLAAAPLAAGLAASGTAHAASIGHSYSTPGQYTFTVPAGVTSLDIRVAGAGGGQDAFGDDCVPGKGAMALDEAAVTPGERLTVSVGGAGGDATGAAGGAGGVGGGGAGGTAGAGGYGGGGGGGSSRVTLDDLVLAAGGGGGCGAGADGSLGQGGDDQAAGGDGNLGADGQRATGGAPAPSQAGGWSSPGVVPGAAPGNGGGGGAGADGPYFGGGGGGGGLLGGGGGGAAGLDDGIAGGGAGGSDGVRPEGGDTGGTITTQSGTQSGDGLVTLRWSQPGTGVGELFAPTTAFDADETLLGDDGSPLRQLPFSPSWTVPSDGVITSWAYEAGSDAPAGVELKVAQAQAGGGEQIVGGATGTAWIVPDAIAVFPARIPVSAGETIGAAFEGTGEVLPVPGAGVVATDGDQAPGDPAATYRAIGPSGGPLGYDIGVGPPPQGVALPVEAFVEPDADHDGFGDATQDQCPGVAGSDEGCPVFDLGVMSSGLGGGATAGDTLSQTFTVTDHGPDPVSEATLAIVPSGGGEVVSATPSTGGGRCSAGAPVRCTLGALGRGESATVRVLLRATAAGSLSDTATVTGPSVAAGIGAGDSDPSDDSASDAVTIAPASPNGGTGTGSGGTGTGSGGTGTGGTGSGSGATGTGTGGPGTNPTAPGAPTPTPTRRARFAGARLHGPITATAHRATLTVVSATAARGTVTLTASGSVGAGGHSRIRTVRLARGQFAVTAGHPTRIRLGLDRTTLALLRAHHGVIRVQVTLASRPATVRSARSVVVRASRRLRLAR